MREECHLLYFRGEAEAQGVPLAVAEQKLIQKTIWDPTFIGHLPYVFAFAVQCMRYQARIVCIATCWARWQNKVGVYWMRVRHDEDQGCI